MLPPRIALWWTVGALSVNLAWAGCGLSSGPTWRADGRCGARYPLASNDPSTCDGRSERPCCSDFGYCGISDSHCNCPECIDYRRVLRREGCVMRFSGTEGVMESQGFPQPYPANMECCYDIERPDSTYCGVRLFFDTFDLEGTIDPYCQKDWLAAEYCVPEKGARMCGNLTGGTHEYLFQPGASALRFTFNSDAYNLHMGFRIRYRLLKDCSGPYVDPVASEIPGTAGAKCYTKVVNRRGSINTPYYPSNYPENVDCVYEFERSDPLVCGIRMRSQVFELQEPFESPFGGACTDFFHCPGCGYLCGTVAFSWVARYQPNATALKFHFHSDETEPRKGFAASFEQIYNCE